MLSRSGLNLQFAGCPCRFALVSLCSNSYEEKSLWEPVRIFQWLRVHLNITLWMEVLEPRMNALLNCLATWRLCLHISRPPQSTFYASRVQPPIVFPSRVAWDPSRALWPDFFSQLFTQLFPGIASFSCPLILCMKLNFGRIMLASLRQNLSRGSSSLPVRVSSGFSDASDSACGV